MRGAIPQLPKYALMAWCSLKAQGRLYRYTVKSFLLVSRCKYRLELLEKRVMKEKSTLKREEKRQ